MNPSAHFTFLRLSREGEPNHTLNLWEQRPQARFDPEGLCPHDGRFGSNPLSKNTLEK
jgi:hypothetical protein